MNFSNPVFFCKPCLIYQNIIRYLEGRGWKVRWIPGVSRKGKSFQRQNKVMIEIMCTVESYTIWPGTCIKKVDKVHFDFMLIMVSCAGCLFLVKTQCLFQLDSAGLEYLLMSLTFSARGSKCFIQPKETQKHLLSVELFYLHCLLPFGLISQHLHCTVIHSYFWTCISLLHKYIHTEIFKNTVIVIV